MTTPHAPTYVYKNGFGKYYFRIAVPRKIRDITGKYEIRRSLKTTSYSIAVRRARRMAVLAEVFFQQDQHIMHNNGYDPFGPFGKQIIIRGFSKSADGSVSCDSIEMDPDKMDQEKELLKAAKETLLEADTTPTQQQQVQVVPTAPLEQEGLLLSELIEKYVQCQIDEGSWKEKTTHENQAIFELLKRIMGDVAIQGITHDNSDAFRSTLLKLPPGINKSPKWKDLSIGQIIELQPAKTLSTSSINKYMRRISAMFNWAEERDYVLKNRFCKKQIQEDKKPNQRRDMLTSEDLAALFDPQQFHAAADKPFKYWLPLIALYTGARQDEIASLDGKDIMKVHGIWCFKFITSKQKEYTERVVPIHPKLKELGIIEYAQAQSDKLFPELPKGRDGYGQTVSKWYGRYRRRCGLSETRNKDFHSYRHTLATSLEILNVKDKIISEIVGHATNDGQRKTTTQAVYIKDSELKVLKEAIEKLDYGEPLSHVKPFEELF